jgi:alkanal monooxygenase alpha chain
LHLGLTPWNFNDLSAASLTAQARFAEAIGYESFWLPENHFNAHAIPDPLMLLAGVAAGTETMRLATTSFLLPLRHPLLAAEQVAVLDRLSNGRVLLGVGRGYSHQALQAFNIDPADKRRQFEWALDLMMRAWAGEPVSVGADSETAVVVDPLPVQRPHPPIWVAAFGPKALAQAGGLGMPYLASPIETVNEVRENLERHAEAVAHAGHAPITTRPIMRTIFVSDDAADIAALRERLAENKLPTGRKPRAAVDDWAIVGTPNYVADKLAEYEDVLAATHMVVTRLRLDGVEEAKLCDSLARVAELV